MTHDRRAWWLVGFLWLAFCLNFADRQVVFSMFPVLKAELRFTDTQLGLTGALFLWVYAICSPLAGHIGDRFSKKILVAVSLVLWSGVTALTGAAHSPVLLLSCRALIGVTESLFYPAAVALIANMHMPETRSRAFAFFNSGNVFGVILGGWYGGLMAQEFHWRLAFYSLGAAGVLYACPLLMFLKRLPPHAGSEPKRPANAAGILQVFRTPTYLVTCAVYSAFAFTSYLFYTWLPTFLFEKFSLGLASAGITATAYLQGASVAGLIAGGWIADRLMLYTKASRLWVLTAAMLLAAPCAHWVGSASSLLLTKIAALGFGFCSGLYLANLVAAALDVVAPPRRASAAGLLNLIGAFVSGFAGLLGGIWKQKFGVSVLMTCSGIGCLGAGLLLICAIRFWFAGDYSKVNPYEEIATA